MRESRIDIKIRKMIELCVIGVIGGVACIAMTLISIYLFGE